MAIPFEKDFLQMAKEKNLNCFIMKRVEFDLLFEDDIDYFLNFASQQCDTIYYRFDYRQRSEVFIDGNTIEHANSDNFKLLHSLGISVDFPWFLDDNKPKDKVIKEYGDIFTDIEYSLRDRINDYNSSIDESLLSIPIGLVVCCLLQGKVVGVHIEDDSKLLELGFTDSQSALLDLLWEYKETAEKMLEERKQIKAEVKEKLRCYLLDDLKFQLSTNKQLRKRYAQDLWDDRQFDWIRDGFPSDSYLPFLPPEDLVIFIEYTYSEYKEMKKRK